MRTREDEGTLFATLATRVYETRDIQQSCDDGVTLVTATLYSGRLTRNSGHRHTLCSVLYLSALNHHYATLPFISSPHPSLAISFPFSQLSTCIIFIFTPSMLLSTQERRPDDSSTGIALLAYRRTSIPSIEAISIASSSSSSSGSSSIHRRAPLAPLPTQASSMLDDQMSSSSHSSSQFSYPIQDQALSMDFDPTQDFARVIGRPITTSRSSLYDDPMSIPPRKRSIPGQ